MLFSAINKARYYRASLGTREATKVYVGRALHRTIRVRPPGVQHPVVCRAWDADRVTLCHVFGSRDAEPPIPIEPRLIVDAGANVGYVSVYYANRYPDARIVALEPDDRNFALAQQNCAGYPSIELLRAGLWPHDARLSTVEPDVGYKSWGIRTEETNSGGIEGVSIPTLLGRLGEERIDLLKLDIEGAEIPLFANADDWLPCVGIVLIETHGPESERATSTAMRDAGLERLGDGHRLAFVNPRHPAISPDATDPRASTP